MHPCEQVIRDVGVCARTPVKIVDPKYSRPLPVLSYFTELAHPYLPYTLYHPH